MPRWHTDYERADDGWRIICPYCRRSTTRPLLSAALRAALAHEDVCPGRDDLEGGP